MGGCGAIYRQPAVYAALHRAAEYFPRETTDLSHLVLPPGVPVAERGSSGLIVRLLLRLTHFWRRRIDAFEVLGVDQARRLDG